MALRVLLACLASEKISQMVSGCAHRVGGRPGSADVQLTHRRWFSPRSWAKPCYLVHVDRVDLDKLAKEFAAGAMTQCPFSPELIAEGLELLFCAHEARQCKIPVHEQSSSCQRSRSCCEQLAILTSELSFLLSSLLLRVCVLV